MPRMFEPKLPLPESVAKDDCHIGSDWKMNQEFSQTSPVAEGADRTRFRKTENVDLPQIAADLGNPHDHLEKEKNDSNVQCYLEKIEEMLKYQESMLVDLLNATRKIARKGMNVPLRQSGLGYVRDSERTVAVGAKSTFRFSIGGPRSTFADEERNYPSQMGAPNVWRLPTEALTTSSAHRNMWQFLEDRNSGPGARFTAACLSLIALSNIVVLFFDVCYSLDDGVLWPLIVCHFILAAEFLVRFRVSPSQTVFMCNLPNIFEMICLVVFSACFVNRAFAETRWHEAQQPFYRIWLFLPALMMMRAARRFKIFQLLSGAFKVAVNVLPLLMYSLAIIVASFAAIIAAVEPRENVASYEEALWLVIVTVFTVGYGDYAPSTDYGRLACSVLMMITCLYMAIPIGIVGTAFTRVWEDKDRLVALQDLRDQISWAGLGVEDALHIFEMCTEGSMDGISLAAFKGIILGIQCEWHEDVIQHVFNLLDQDGCGSLDIDEFLFGLFPRQRFFWKQAVEKIKQGGSLELIQNLPTGRSSNFEKIAEENEDSFRPNRSENDQNHARTNRPEKDLKNDQKELDGITI